MKLYKQRRGAPGGTEPVRARVSACSGRGRQRNPAAHGRDRGDDAGDATTAQSSPSPLPLFSPLNSVHVTHAGMTLPRC